MMNKRLKIEKKKQEHFLNQKKIIEQYKEKKKETESLLRIGYFKKEKVGIYFSI